MHAEPQMLLQAARAAAAEVSAKAAKVKSGGAALVVSCSGRRLALGTDAAEEAEAARDILPVDHAFTGFYSFGGIFTSGGTADVGSQAFCITRIAEEPA
jgi:hypothetical protein